jgi:hypothetical protein
VLDRRIEVVENFMRLVEQLLEFGRQEIGILDENDGLFVDVFQETLAVFLEEFVLDVGDDRDFFLARSSCVSTSKLLMLSTSLPKFNPVRMVV